MEKPSSVGTLSQAVNFTCYQMFKTQLSTYLGRDELASWQHMLLGGLSGGIGPCVNNPLDVVKTRLQKQVRLFLCICVLRSSRWNMSSKRAPV